MLKAGTKMAAKTSRYFIGADLGQAQDYTAIAIIERLEAGEAGSASEAGTGAPVMRRGRPVSHNLYHVGHLERFPLGMSYTDQADRIRRLVNHPALAEERRNKSTYRIDTIRPSLAVDYTGVGRGVVDILRDYGLAFDPVTITGGGEQHKEKGSFRVPKDDLLTGLEVSIKEGWLEIAASLDHAATLREEAMNVKRDQNIATGHVAYRPWRESVHDDLLLATSLACWSAGRARGRAMLSGPLGNGY